MKKALILGGTSFFGRDIARFFHEAGYAITLFTRGNRMPPDLPPHQHIRGDRHRNDDLRRAAGDWDVVVDNIAFDGDAVGNALAVFASAKRYLLCSTVAVYRYVRDPYPQPLREGAVDFDYRPAAEDLTDVHWKYARGKLEAERATMSQSKVPWTILRPPVVYGPFDITDRGFWYLGRLLKGGPILMPNGGINSFRLVYSVDSAKSFLLAAERAHAAGRIYNIAQSEVITLKDFVLASAEALGTKAELVSIPFEIAGELGGPFYLSMVNLIPDIRLACEELDFHPTPWRDFVATTAHWFREHWKGDERKLLETRSRELKLAARWKEAVASLAV